MNKKLFVIISAFLLAILSTFVIKSLQADENALAPTSSEDNITKPTVILETTQGKIEIQLWPNVAPKTCENFMGLAEKGYYNNVVFHRVIKNFMVQGGDPTGTGRGGESIWGGEFQDEIGTVQFDRKGLLAMANAGPNTNGSQFFITVAATPWLNGRHTIFGEVIGGYDVVEKISLTPTDDQDRPMEKQVIKKAVVSQ